MVLFSTVFGLFVGAGLGTALFLTGNGRAELLILAGFIGTFPAMAMVFTEHRWRLHALRSAGDLIAQPHWYAPFAPLLGVLVCFGGALYVVFQLKVPSSIVGFLSGGSVVLGALIPALVMRSISGGVRHLPSQVGQLSLFGVWLISFIATFISYETHSTPVFASFVVICFALFVLLAAPRARFSRFLMSGNTEQIRRALAHWRFTGVMATTRVVGMRAIGQDDHIQEFTYDFARWSGVQQPQLLASLAESWLHCGNVASARQLAFASLSLRPDQPAGWAVMARCDLADECVTPQTLKLFEEALQWHSRGRQAAYSTAHWHAQLARTHLALGQRVEAERSLDEALSNLPTLNKTQLAEAWFEIGKAQRALGANADAAFSEARRAAPGARWDVPTDGAQSACP